MTVGEALRRYALDHDAKYVAIVRLYLESSDGAITDAALARHLHELQRRGLKAGTVDLHRRTVRAFARAAGVRPPSPRGFAYDGHEADRPALSTDLVRSLIEASRSGAAGSREAALVALSTTYGMRAAELAAVEDEDVDRAGERIYIRTVKGGRRRWCWLPPSVAEELPDSWPRSTEEAVEAAFERAWDAAIDADRPRGVAWHAIRRALVRDLRGTGAAPERVERFMRWRAGTASARMVELYSAPTHQVTEGGLERERLEDEGARGYDQAVWDSHPYLELWR